MFSMLFLTTALIAADPEPVRREWTIDGSEPTRPQSECRAEGITR